MATHASAKLLVGRRIVGYEPHPFESREHPELGSQVAHFPVLTLDNGARLTFATEETEVGEYGTAIIYHAPRRKAP